MQLLRKSMAEQAKLGSKYWGVRPDEFEVFTGVGTRLVEGESDEDDDFDEFRSPAHSLSRQNSAEQQRSAKERWHRAMRKIKMVHAFGGSIADRPLVNVAMESKRQVARAELLSSEKE